jgi:DNA-binding MarR family transcriptional regulator
VTSTERETLDSADTEPRRLSLLYQLYLTGQASRRFMRLALADTELTGEAYALYSYLYANGPRTLTQMARDMGMPITSLSTVLAPIVDAGDIERRSHPRDGRARLLLLTHAGRARVEAAMPAFTAAHQALVRELNDRGADAEEVHRALAGLRQGLNATSRLLDPLSPEFETE